MGTMIFEFVKQLEELEAETGGTAEFDGALACLILEEQEEEWTRERSLRVMRQSMSPNPSEDISEETQTDLDFLIDKFENDPKYQPAGES